MKENLELFNVEIGIRPKDEIFGSIENLFTIYRKPNDEFGLIWNEKTKDQIRYEIAELFTRCFVPTRI